MFAHLLDYGPILLKSNYHVTILHRTKFLGAFQNAEGKVNGLIPFFLAGVSAQNPFILMNTFLMYDNEEIFIHQTIAK